jgi:flagellar FliL protein
MADTPLDSSRNGGRQASVEAEAKPEGGAAVAAPSGGIKSWLPLIITVVCMPALAYATTKFVLVPQMKKSLAESSGVTAASDAPGDSKVPTSTDGTGTNAKVKVPLSKILVNVAGTMGTRYLMTSITLVGTSETLRAKVDENKDQLMDLATSTLSTKTISDLEKPGARNVIRAELITIFNNALGGPWITEIYITEMAIQ